MKVAITGHKRGIGKACADLFTADGHQVVGFSRTPLRYTSTNAPSVNVRVAPLASAPLTDVAPLDATYTNRLRTPKLGDFPMYGIYLFSLTTIQRTRHCI